MKVDGEQGGRKKKKNQSKLSEILFAKFPAAAQSEFLWPSYKPLKIGVSNGNADRPFIW